MMYISASKICQICTMWASMPLRKCQEEIWPSEETQNCDFLQEKEGAAKPKIGQK